MDINMPKKYDDSEKTFKLIFTGFSLITLDSHLEII